MSVEILHLEKEDLTPEPAEEEAEEIVIKNSGPVREEITAGDVITIRWEGGRFSGTVLEVSTDGQSLRVDAGPFGLHTIPTEHCSLLEKASEHTREPFLVIFFYSELCDSCPIVTYSSEFDRCPEFLGDEDFDFGSMQSNWLREDFVLPDRTGFYKFEGEFVMDKFDDLTCIEGDKEEYRMLSQEEMEELVKTME